MINQVEMIVNENRILHIECSTELSLQIIEMIKSLDDIALLSKEEYFYDDMKVKEYLMFFADIIGHPENYQKAIDIMCLSDIQHINISKCTNGQKRRIALAREILKDAQVYCLHEPISEIDQESMKIILRWMDTFLSSNKRIVTTSRSLKEICLCPGPHYYIKGQEVECIDKDERVEESLDSATIQKLMVRANEKMFLFSPEEIDYIEARDGKTCVYVRGDIYISSLTMEEIDYKLQRFGFYRSHRSYLVNMQKVIEIIKWTRNSFSLKLTNYEETMVPLSKTKIQEIKEIYQF